MCASRWQKVRAKPATAPFVFLTMAYRIFLSPVLQMIGVRCRHEPSCSVYALDAFGRHGVMGGVWLTLSRLSRCHPWGSHGFDPVPEALPKVGWQVWRYGDWAWSPRFGPRPMSDVGVEETNASSAGPPPS
ncbi:MAG: membrane protein insertion efficiency factor YidD [Pseudomonadota bacterium]